MDDFTDHAEIRNSAKEEEKVLVFVHFGGIGNKGRGEKMF